MKEKKLPLLTLRQSVPKFVQLHTSLSALTCDRFLLCCQQQSSRFVALKPFLKRTCTQELGQRREVRYWKNLQCSFCKNTKKDRRIADPAGCTLKVPTKKKDFLFKSNNRFRDSLTQKAEGKKTCTSAVVQFQRTILKSHYIVSASGCQWKVIAFLCEIGLKIMTFYIYIYVYMDIYICMCVFLVLSATLKTRSPHLQK